ncbi:MAG: hypothetical protein WCX48_11205 [Bacteroidales bacterium]|jgi:hypothetical protein
MTCVYLNEQLCLKGSGDACCNCKDKLEVNDPKFNEKWIDPLVILNRRREPCNESIRDLLAGGSAFLMGGGPSANDLPLEQLSRRGLWTMCVNNSAGHPRIRPQAFVCSDPPKKFSHSIWLDPAIMKFVPTAKLSGRRSRLRRKMPDGTFADLTKASNTCPNVWAFQRWSWLWPDDRFFSTDGACWGNHGAGTEKTGQPKTVCTMLLALRLLRFLGARRVYLIGVDFKMAPDYGYSFGQARDAGASASNNAQFSVVNKWLVEMQQGGVFERFGMEVYNCFEFSGLRAFPYVPFEQAVEEAKGIVEDKPDLSGWYEK